MKSKDWKGLSKTLMAGSLIAVVMAGIGYLGTDIWLASTQWLLVAAVLALFGMFAKLSSK